jgi:cytochrome c553
LLFLILIGGCAPTGPHKPIGLEGIQGEVTYKDVTPIFASHCAACHPSRSGPNWLDYGQAKPYVDNGRLLQRAVQQKSMPPPGSAQAASITERERLVIGRWVQNGGPRGGGPPPPVGPPVPAVVQQQCQHCHGAGAPSAQPKIPRLRGQSEEYLLAQLERFKWRERIDPSGSMNDVALGLSAADMKTAANFYASLGGRLYSGVPPESGVSPLYEQGRKLANGERSGLKCVFCHLNPDAGDKANDPSIPEIAGQARDYLMTRLIFFRGDDKLSPLMHELAKDLSHGDIEALTAYFSAVRPE